MTDGELAQEIADAERNYERWLLVVQSTRTQSSIVALSEARRRLDDAYDELMARERAGVTCVKP